MTQTVYRRERIMAIGGSFIVGSVVLLSLSFIQKIAAGFNPFVLKSYWVPLLFGGLSGALLATRMIRIRELNRILQQRVNALEDLLPICSSCKRIRKRDSDPAEMDSWESIESYITKRTESQFSHGICPDCAKELYPDLNIFDESETNSRPHS